jgi:hypothetical protein
MTSPGSERTPHEGSWHRLREDAGCVSHSGQSWSGQYHQEKASPGMPWLLSSTGRAPKQLLKAFVLAAKSVPVLIGLGDPSGTDEGVAGFDCHCDMGPEQGSTSGEMVPSEQSG